MPVSIPLKQFLLIDPCPAEWHGYDLYLLRDEDVVFYVGQSHVAFERVWEHVRNGFRARSVVGRFLLANWPASLRFVVELQASADAGFAGVAHDLNAAERLLIEQYTPCFNAALNRVPAPLPPRYAPPSAPLRCSRSLKHLIREAEIAVKADARRRMLDELT